MHSADALTFVGKAARIPPDHRVLRARIVWFPQYPALRTPRLRELHSLSLPMRAGRTIHFIAGQLIKPLREKGPLSVSGANIRSGTFQVRPPEATGIGIGGISVILWFRYFVRAADGTKKPPRIAPGPIRPGKLIVVIHAVH